MRNPIRSSWAARPRWRLPLLVFLVLAQASLLAAPLTEKQVRAAVETWVRQVTAESRPDATIQRLEAQVVDGRTVAFVAHLNDDGFCLCGADDLLLPVYFYSPHGQFDASNPGTRLILEEIQARLAAYQQNVQQKSLLPEGQETFAARAASWEALMAGRLPAARQSKSMRAPGAPPTQVILPLTSKWGQGSPYNDQCPAVPSTPPEHTVVGCVATAMAQIMNYWKWPAAGYGVSNVVFGYRYRTNWDSYPLSSLYWPSGLSGFDTNRLRGSRSSSGIVLQMTGYWDGGLRDAAKRITGTNPSYSNAVEVLFSRLTQQQAVSTRDLSTPIRWDLIGDRHADPPDDGDAAVAEFCANVGAAAWMGYGLRGSATSIPNVPVALRNNFFYDPSVVWVAPADRSIDEMTAEIQWLRPIQMDGTAPGLGIHDFVVHGYNLSTDPDRQFLFNFGWGGNSDGWYSCDAIQFYHSLNYVKNIAPKDAVKFVGATVAGSGSPASPYQNLAAAVTAAPDHATLIFKAGSINTFAASSLTINRPLTLKGQSVTIRKQ